MEYTYTPENVCPIQIEEKLLGNTCGRRHTSCADQLSKAVRVAYSKTNN